MAQSRARVFPWGVTPVLVARRSPFSQPSALAALVGALLPARGGFAEHRTVRHSHLLRTRSLSHLSGCPAAIRNNSAQRPKRRRCDYVGARLAGLSDSCGWYRFSPPLGRPATHATANPSCRNHE